MTLNRIKKIIKSLLRIHQKCDFWRKRQINKYIKLHDVAKLQIGCGPYPIKGWLNTDFELEKCKNGVIFLDAGKLFPIPDASFDYIYSEHLFEHLKYTQAKNMLQECFRILKPNGVLRIATPNLQFLVDLYLHPEKDINRSYIEFDAKRSYLPPHPVYAINRFHTTWGHQIIHDPESLTDLLEKAGFRDICRCEMSKSCHAHLNNVENHFKHLKYEYNLVQTMIFEAQR